MAAAEVLTTAMNLYGISLSDPMKAAAALTNVMAAAGQAGYTGKVIPACFQKPTSRPCP